MARWFARVLAWSAGRIPTLIVWAGLGGLFAFGMANGWKFRGNEKAPAPHASGEEAEPAVFSSYFEEQPFDIPVQVTHDPEHCPVFPSRFSSRSAGAAAVGPLAWIEYSPKAIRLESAKSARLVGITTWKVEPRQIQAEVTAHGEVRQDPLAIATISPRVGGVFVELEKELGDPVRRGELLALVESPEVGKAKSEYHAAKVELESREAEKAVLSPGLSPQASLVKADAAVRSARAALATARQAIANLALPLPTRDEERLPDEEFSRRLALLGIPYFKRLELQIRADSERLPLPANLLPLYSPIDGVILRRTGMIGETVAALKPVFEVCDPTLVYVFLDVRQEDLPKVALGQEMRYRLEGGAEVPESLGKIDWISPMMDIKTRSVQVRARVPNSSGLLKSGSFGAGTIVVAPAHSAVVIPRAAVQWEGCSHLVFVRKRENGATVFEPRRVVLGARDESGIEVLSGLAVGERVVVGGSHVLKSELLKSRIGESEE